MGEHLQDGSLAVPNVFLMEGLNVLFVDVCENRLDSDLDVNILVDESRLQGQLPLLKLEEVSSLCVCRDHRVDKFGIVDATEVKVFVVRNDPRLVLVEYERDIPMTPPPMLRKGRSSRNLLIILVSFGRCGSSRRSPS